MIRRIYPHNPRIQKKKKKKKAITTTITSEREEIQFRTCQQRPSNKGRQLAWWFRFGKIPYRCSWSVLSLTTVLVLRWHRALKSNCLTSTKVLVLLSCPNNSERVHAAYSERRSCVKVEVAIHGLPVANSPYSLFGRKATFNCLYQ